ncbi:MAG: molecular chaperone TorD family protein [Anaerolineales bacterium]
MAQSDLSKCKETLIGEVLVFSLLGKALYEELDKYWLDTLIREDMFAEIPFGEEQTEVQRGLELLRHWTTENREGVSEKEFKIVKRDQLYLFVGTDQVLAPVWESVYFSAEHLVFQEQTLQVRQWYSRFGLQAERINREPDDHIGIELSFVSHLAKQALHAVDQNDEQNYEDLLQAQRDFLSEHLLRWAPVWAKLVKQNAETDFYRGLAHLTHGALLEAADFLQIKIPKEVKF